MLLLYNFYFFSIFRYTIFWWGQRSNHPELWTIWNKQLVCMSSLLLNQWDPHNTGYIIGWLISLPQHRPCADCPHVGLCCVCSVHVSVLCQTTGWINDGTWWHIEWRECNFQLHNYMYRENAMAVFYMLSVLLARVLPRNTWVVA